MFETHVFARSTAHSAVLYWDKPAAAGAGAQYTVYLGGQPVATCCRTHFTLTDLRSQSDYQADVFFGHQCVGSCVFRTTPVKNRLDVTEAPFWARGDGKTKNTAALQRAIDACGAGDAVYIPARHLPDRRAAAAQQHGAVPGRGRHLAGHRRDCRLPAPHPQPV